MASAPPEYVSKVSVIEIWGEIKRSLYFFLHLIIITIKTAIKQKLKHGKIRLRWVNDFE